VKTPQSRENGRAQNKSLVIGGLLVDENGRNFDQNWHGREIARVFTQPGSIRDGRDDQTPAVGLTGSKGGNPAVRSPRLERRGRAHCGRSRPMWRFSKADAVPARRFRRPWVITVIPAGVVGALDLHQACKTADDQCCDDARKCFIIAVAANI
jgi:hypothetical protein